MLFSSMGFCQGELLIGVDLLLFFCFEFPMILKFTGYSNAVTIESD